MATACVVRGCGCAVHAWIYVLAGDQGVCESHSVRWLVLEAQHATGLRALPLSRRAARLRQLFEDFIRAMAAEIQNEVKGG